MKYFKYERNAEYQIKYPLGFTFMKHLQAVGPSFETIAKPLSIKTGKRFCDGLK